MKVLLLTLFVAAVSAIPLPEEDVGPVDVIVNGLADGEALEIGDIVDIKLKENVDGQVVATNLLHPFTAVGIAETAAAAAAAAAAEQPIAPAPITLPNPAIPVVVPEPIVLPQPAKPDVIPDPVVLPDPLVLPAPAQPDVEAPVDAYVPAPIVLPQPALPDVVLPAPSEDVPSEVAPVPQTNEVFNDGVVSVVVNGQEPGMFSTLQSWFSMVLNYFSNGVQTSHQIV